MGRMGPGLTSMAMCSCMLTLGGRRRPGGAVPSMGARTCGPAQSDPDGLGTGGTHPATETERGGIAEAIRGVLGQSGGPEVKVSSLEGRGELGAHGRVGRQPAGLLTNLELLHRALGALGTAEVTVWAGV